MSVYWDQLRDFMVNRQTIRQISAARLGSSNRSSHVWILSREPLIE